MSNIPCILQCGRVCSKATDAITSIEKWDTLKNNTELWSGLDKFGDVHTSIDWDTGPVGHCVHDTCRLTLCNATKLEQANNRQKKRVVDECQAQSSSTSDISSTAATPSFKRLRSSLGLIHDKNKCVWCCKTESAKHPESKLVLISYDHAWAAFKSHTVALEDELMRDRINCLINYAADQPYALEIRYHHKCWFKYVRNYQRMSEDDKLPHMHNVTLREAQTIFFDNIRTVIFDEHELRSLQSLLRDYSSIVSRYGFPTSGVKSSYIKDILTREFKDKIGFHSRPQRNQSDLVYDTSGSGSYVEAAISSIGVSSEQLVQNVAARLRDDVKSIKLVPWPPRVEELEEEEELPPLVLQLLSALQGKHGVDLSPSTLSLTSLITQYIIKRPTTTAINATVTLHGLTRSKELVDSYYKLGMGISYPNVLLLRDVWTMHDLERCSVCPAEIAEGEPSISIIDNDDFRNDTLTGGGTSHRCNWMFLQREERLVHKHEANTQDEQPRIKHAKTVSDVLTEKASEMQTVMPYRTVKRGEPPIRPKPTTVSSSTEPQRQRSIIHALARADVNGDRPVAAEQNIPSYNGFHAGLNMWQDKSKAYFHTSYNQPPDKSVVKDVMDKLVTIIATKHMPFAFLVGDHPVYVLITLLKAENPSKFSAIVPFLGPFHTQCVMSAIYKRYKGSELGEVLVAAGVIADGSVDRALKGKHYKRGLRCLRLMYEALMCQLMKENLGPDLADETRENLDILRDMSQSEESRADAHVALENDADLKSLVTNMFTHVEASDMANYWRDFLSMTDALMQNVHAVHICNWDEYVSSLRAMLPWMVAYDNNRYGKWLPDFWAMLTALPADQVAFLRTDFTQSITGNPYSNMAWDMWIECTMNKGSKMKSGWLSILQNEKQLLVHSRNVNNVAQIRAAHNALANRKKTKRKHTECGPKRMREDEQCVQDLVECMHEFDTFPFDTASTTLRTLQSAMPASDELVADFNSAHAAGDGNPYKWSDYVHKLSSIILARHHNAHRIICVNDPYDTAYSTKDDERDLRVQGNTHVPNTYMKLGDAFPTARMFKTLLCSSSNKGRLQKMICSYLTDLAQSVDVEIVYSVGSHCTNLSTQQPMQNYSFDQSEADTVLFSTYVVLRESGYSGPVVIDATDTDVYVAAALISQQLPGMLCIKRKQETVRCCDMTTDMMADCIVQLHCMTGCDANSGFYGKGKKSVYDQVAKSPVARQQLSRCGDNLALTEEVLEQLFAFTRSIIYGDNKSKTMAEARAAKWRTIKKKSFIRLPPDADSLRQHCLRANYLAYLVRHPSLKHHPSPIGHGWELVGGCCRPVRHTRPALPMHLPAPRPTEEGQEDESDDDDENRVAAVQRGDSSESEDSECSEAGCSDSD
ncbi:Serine/threonine-protein kinase ATG1 [Dissostichus eleginoides]|uniref:Serine/threonine-protein kinase ATG1 n=1 Tax=Dissostichus eleginoides TaxID=100907 RepID=A0AAD9C2N8_DISEL|nr:Serine/threonine-protein kinase ATG1 [Dissostichus eleginoides]